MPEGLLILGYTFMFENPCFYYILVYLSLTFRFCILVSGSWEKISSEMIDISVSFTRFTRCSVV